MSVEGKVAAIFITICGPLENIEEERRVVEAVDSHDIGKIRDIFVNKKALHPLTLAEDMAFLRERLGELRPSNKRDKDILTSRQHLIMDLVMRGMHSKQIAKELAISERTVGNHISEIYAKLGVNNRAQALLKYLSMSKALPSQ